MNAAMKKSADDATVKTATNRALSSPAGIARNFVLGFAASNSRSTSRLNAIAAERAPIIATTIHKIRSHAGRPLAASTAPRNANGSAKSVCSILIISSVIFRLRSIVSGVGSGEWGVGEERRVGSGEWGMGTDP